MSRPRTFGQLGEVFDGPHATPRRLDQGPYFLSISSLDKGRLNLDLSDHVSPADFALWTRRIEPREGDLLFSYETRLGEAALMPARVEACLGRRMALLRPDTSVVDPRFLLYYYLSPYFQSVIAERAVHGATVSRIPLIHMGSWPVDIPPIDKQRRIAEVLGALDEKIAANRLLVKATQLLAASIFERASERAAQTTSTFGEVARIDGGSTPSTTEPDYWTGDVAWATPTDVTALPSPYLRRTARTISQAGLSACSSPLFDPGSILMTSRATIGAFAIAQVPTAVNQGFIVVRPRETKLLWWLFHDMQKRVDEFKAQANGATFLELPRGRFRDLPVEIPHAEELEGFARKAEPLHARAAAGAAESEQLAGLRDTLLPKLMSGELRVKDAEKQVEEVV